MQPLQTGRYRIRLAEGQDDLRAAQTLRWLCFLGDYDRTLAAPHPLLDTDALDARCQHALIEELSDGRLVGCFRFLSLASGAEVARSYSAQFYDLGALETFAGPMVEVGRFCIHPEVRDPDVVRLAWTALTRHVDEHGVQMLFGCSSFVGTDPAPYAEVFALLRDRHLAPRRWWPRVKAPRVVRFARTPRDVRPYPRRAMAQMPPLLRSYLAMGGWVSDHAVVDDELHSMHVFTGVEVGAIPEPRKRLLRAASA